jgi:Restriction alleviation protein Lar
MGLLRCPFCWSDEISFHRDLLLYYCNSCGCRGPSSDDDEYEAARLWNRREKKRER